MDIHYILNRLGQELDKNHYFGDHASDAQIKAVRLYLQGFVGRDNYQRYRIIQALFELPELPETSKILTKGQASALIGISRHEQYGPVLYDHILNL